jgi:hypothetical protein
MTITKDSLIKLMKKVSNDLGVHPHQLKLSDLRDVQDNLTDWSLRPFGGLKGLKLYFDPPVADHATLFEQKNLSKGSKSKLNKKEVEEYEKLLSSEILKKISPVKVKSYKPKSSGNKKEIKRHVVAMLNDIHIGLKVDKDEVDGINEFNFEIASRRIAMFIKEVCEYKHERRDSVERMHLLLNGDLIAGVIHGLLSRDLELLTHQTNGAIHILSNAISRLAENFKNVTVYFSTGNHGDLPTRREGGHRVTSQIYDSIEAQIFYAISAAHRKTKNVTFKCNKTTYMDIDLPSGRAIFTHGHIMFSKQLGNPGRNINVKGLSESIMKFNNGEKKKGRAPVKLILLGHTHANFSFVTEDGVKVYNAPSLSGVDSFAFQLGIVHNMIGQLVFESTDKYMFGDSRLVEVQEADKNSSLDKIIAPYNYDLVYKG